MGTSEGIQGKKAEWGRKTGGEISGDR